MKETGGSAEDVTDDQIREGIKLLARMRRHFCRDRRRRDRRRGQETDCLRRHSRR